MPEIDVARMTEEYHRGFSIAQIAEARGLTPNEARELMLLNHPAVKRHRSPEPTTVGMIKYRQLEYENKKLREENDKLKLLIPVEAMTADSVKESVR